MRTQTIPKQGGQVGIRGEQVREFMLDVPPSLVKWEANLQIGMGWAEVGQWKWVGAKESEGNKGHSGDCDEVNKERIFAKQQ